MKKKRNAFTLVELLAVIVILAVILVIAVPRITKVIEQSKKGALESSAKLIASSLETKYKEELALGTDDISTSTSKTCPASMYDSTLYNCTYTLNSDTGKATVSLIGKTDSKFEKLGVDATTTEATSFKLGDAITITFDSQGGSAVESKTLTSGDAYGTLANPTKSGVTFKGWYTDATNGSKVTSTDIAKSSITLYAHYAETVELSSSWKTTINGKTVDTLTIVSQGASSNIKSIKFYDNSDNVYDTTGKTFIANVSTTGETIKAYGVVDSTDTTKIAIDIVGDSLIAFSSDSSYLFYDLRNLNTLDFNDAITTSNVTSMSRMFYQTGFSSTVFTLDLSSFDTSNVTNMGYMFECCYTLTSLDVSSFDTSNVKNMVSMFDCCLALTSIDLSSFDTSNVTNMSKMFRYCFALTSLNLSSFDTSNVTNMSWMFAMLSTNNSTSINGVYYYGNSNGANRLTEIKGLSSFDTSKVTNISYMFEGCYLLANLDLSNFDTSNVTNMSFMFHGCSLLANLDLSSFDTSKVTNMSYMFEYCSSLTSLNLSNFDTSNVTNMSYMFAWCGKLTSLNLSNFDTSKVTTMSSMFSYCSALTSLNVSNFDTSNITNMYGMFYYCSSLTSIDLSNFDTSKVTNMSYMFSGCSKLTSLTIPATNGNDISNTADVMYGSTTSVSVTVSASNRTVTLK